MGQRHDLSPFFTPNDCIAVYLNSFSRSLLIALPQIS
jgi:hypothetical protein